MNCSEVLMLGGIGKSRLFGADGFRADAGLLAYVGPKLIERAAPPCGPDLGS